MKSNYLYGARVLLTAAFLIGVMTVTNHCEAQRTPTLSQPDRHGVRRLSRPVRCSEYEELAGDPAVMLDGAKFRMFCTGLDKQVKGGGISEAVSANGMDWNLATAGDAKTGLGIVLRGQPKSWDYQLETAYPVLFAGKTFLYYCGYPKVGWPKNPGQIGVAIASDAINFCRTHEEAPVLAVTKDGYDANGLYSPVLKPLGNGLAMIYTGHCYKSNRVTPGIYLLGATSNDGVVWKKLDTPVLKPSTQYPFMINGVGESEILLGPDKKYYLLFTGNLGDDEKRLIAVGRSESIFGPYTVRKEPLLEALPGSFDEKGVLAPSALIEGKNLRLWYLTSNGDKHMTGYAEMPWPPKF
ncbi:hypothetical protein BH10CYA1_BH10CYA1_58270 [soil metagenome]